jgi:elongator complex protein 1
LETNYQRFKIDDHLKRYEKALRNLSNAGPSFFGQSTFLLRDSHARLGPDRFDEAMVYVEKHRLYDLALSIWEGRENYQVFSVSSRWLWFSIDVGQLDRPECVRRLLVREKRVLAGGSG